MSLFDQVSNSLSGAASSIGTSAVTAAKGLVSTDTASEIIGSVGDLGGVVGQVGGVVGGVLGTQLGLRTPYGRLSPHLMANLYACDADGLMLDSEPVVITAPATDVSIEGSLNWQSPFENSGPESKAPALMALLQSGQLTTAINALQAVNPIESDTVNGVLNATAEKAKKVAEEATGRTGITKLNSRQIFSGMPPIKINMTLHFRALNSALREVMNPYSRLLRWLLPQSLAKDGVLTTVIANSGSENSSVIRALFPSMAPLMVALQYGNGLYSPMVIESFSNQLDGPMDKDGLPLYRAVQIQLSTLTALDRHDVYGLFG